jgi:hypothetical protein
MGIDAADEKQPTPGKSRLTRARAAVAALVAFVVAGVAFANNAFDLREKLLGEQAKGSVVFTEPIPEKDLRVSSRILTVKGTVRLAPNRNLWIVVRDDTSGGGYYPQGLARISRDGAWECDISLGSNTNDDNGPYTVLAVFAAPNAAYQFNEFINTKLSTRTAGMHPYPKDEDAKQMASLTMYRSDPGDPNIPGPRRCRGATS